MPCIHKEPELKTAYPTLHRSTRTWTLILAVVAVAFGIVPGAVAQTTTPAPAAAAAPDADKPSINVGAVLFADYQYQNKPTITDSDGNTVNLSQFEVTRGYINITGNISHLISFRITPDVTRYSQTGNSLDGSMVFRLKYAYFSLSLDDWLPKGSWIRFGEGQTPYIDNFEQTYHYRFQGSTFTDREGYLTTSDFGASFHLAFPKNYGDIHVGMYNGEGYAKAEVNDQKAYEVRLGVRPLPTNAILKGWKLNAFYDDDHSVQNAPRTRAVYNTTFEHQFVIFGVEYLDSHDATSDKPKSVNKHGEGYSVFLNPKYTMANGGSIEALIRYDHMEPNHDLAVVGGATTPGFGTDERTIGGISYWFPHKGTVTTAVMFDVDNVTFPGYVTAQPTQQKFFVHTLVSF
jgi:hypothetical protein